MIFKAQEKVITVLSTQIQSLEQQVLKEALKVFAESENLSQIFKLVTSVKKIRCLTALNLIVHTEGFTKFKNSRKFAPFCGMTPFPNQSGLSIGARTQMGQLANKKTKSFLDMCPKSAIQHSPKIKAWYHNKMAESKNKMSTSNMIRNKILARVFAPVKRGVT